MTTYSLHRGAHTAFALTGVFPLALGLFFLFGAWHRAVISNDDILLIVLGVLFSTGGAWTLRRTFTGRIEFTSREVIVRGVFGTQRFAYDEVVGLGLFKIVILGSGFRGRMIRMKVGGDVSINVFVKTRPKKVRSFIVSMYESPQEVIEQLASRTQKEFVELGRETFRAWAKSAA